MNVVGENPNAPGPYCAGDVAIFRVTNPQPGIQYTWSVSQAKIISGQGTSEIQVKFNSSIYSNTGTAQVTSSGCTTSPTSTLFFNLEDCYGGFAASPNPASTELKVSFKSENDKGRRISIVSETGKTVKETRSHSASIVLNVREIPAGTYYLKIVSDEGTSVRRILIER
ncbi:T9SS type A sorting domain-containing protein [Pontibacter anaerobius]|uniref:T9SS type A sorting domain-containing protein n=1 Tax=Pontibacter anaerobius TaxID=2993940 RepID=A0ABT3REF2_9BACT|nr:T9SS type A sorting domain-containing protein [Pontibacter anaerobius]MCX2740231.1 T9SS type A sorting domain-containing protein [Pontibacter anaerobius]